MNFGWKSQTYGAYMHLLIVKLWNRLYYGAREEPERLGTQYATLWEKWDDFWSEAPTEIIPGLFVGSAKNAADAGSLSRLNISYIVNCTEDLPNFHEGCEDAPSYNRVPLMDVPEASLCGIQDSLEFVVSKIIDKLSQKENVLIHCFMGASRSVSVATLVLMKLNNVPAIDAYGQILSKRKAAKINTSFMTDLRTWQFS